MLALPSPLHPAVVHFPIVLLLLGAAVAIGASVTRRWHLSALAAILLGLGALGALVACQTGEREGELVAEISGVEPVLDAHEQWAARTRNVALAATALALGALFIQRWPRAVPVLRAATAVAALGAAWCVFETGHRGGQLVYRHGAGVNLAPATSDSPKASGGGGD